MIKGLISGHILQVAGRFTPSGSSGGGGGSSIAHNWHAWPDSGLHGACMEPALRVPV